MYVISLRVTRLCFVKHLGISLTVPTFNSCTKCVGSPGIIHDRTPDYHPVSWAWMNGWPHDRTNVALIRKLRGSLMCLTYLWHVIHGCLSDQALADVRSTGEGIKCLYCTLYPRGCSKYPPYTHGKAAWVFDMVELWLIQGSNISHM